MEEEEADPGSEAGMTKRIPRWVVPFLRALERCGVARQAAKDAGIDFSTAYARRRAHEDFAAPWAEALHAYEVRTQAEREEELKALRATVPPHFIPPPTSAAGEELTVSGGQVKRVSRERWGKRNEKAFFAKLAVTANTSLAAEAAGVSENAVGQRRMRDPHFRAKWAAVKEIARASIEMHLIAEAKKSFEAGEMDIGDSKPRVTIEQAIKISQIGAARGGTRRGEPEEAFEEQRGAIPYEDADEIRERLVKKLQRLRKRERPNLIAQGWSYDEQYDRDIPPGWIRDPNWVPPPGGEAAEQSDG